MPIDGFTLSVAGLAITFMVLALLVIAVSLFGRLNARWLAAEERAAKTATRRTPTIDTTTLVLITAAIATHMGGRFRIRRVRRLLDRDAPTSPWSAQGRLVLMGSHVVPRKR